MSATANRYPPQQHVDVPGITTGPRGRHALDTLFVYEWVTASVRAGRRYPIARRRPPDWVGVALDVEAGVDVPPPPRANLVDVEYVNGAGQRVALWTAPLRFRPNAGDFLRFEVSIDR